MVKYNPNWEIMNTYENLQIVQSQFFTDELIFIYIRIFIGLSVFEFVANKYKELFGYIWLFVIFGQLFNEQ